MTALLRRYTFKLYPNKAQAEALERQRRMHCDLYNGLLQQRIEAYQRRGKTLSFYDQGKEITALRRDDPEWRAIPQGAMEQTARRLDLAYQAFFRRAKAGAGAQSGFPRFQSGRTFSGFGFRRHRSGWAFDHSRNRLTLKAVPGPIRARGKFPSEPSELKCSSIIWRDNAWWISIVVEVPVRRDAGHGTGEVRFNLVDHFARVRRTSGECLAGPEDAIFIADKGRILPTSKGLQESPCGLPEIAVETQAKEAVDKFHASCGVAGNEGELQDVGLVHPVRRACGLPKNEGELQAYQGRAERQVMEPPREKDGSPATIPEEKDRSGLTIFAPIQQRQSRCKRGSNKYLALGRVIAARQAKAARQRREALHLWTTQLARQFKDLIVIKPPSIAEVTASGRGDKYEWGAAVEIKAAMNRKVLDQAPAAAIQMLEYKITEGGGTFAAIDDDAAPAAIGNAVVKAKKATRRAKRSISKQREHDSGQQQAAH